jgi:hypothetical protein
MQTLFNRVTYFIRVPNGNFSINGKNFFLSPFNEFVNNGMDIHCENVLYNWMNRASMSISKSGILFKASKKMHLGMVQASINVYSKIAYCVIDLPTLLAGPVP